MTSAMPIQPADLTGAELATYEKACADLYDLLVFMRGKGWSGAVLAKVSLDGSKVRTQRVWTE